MERIKELCVSLPIVVVSEAAEEGLHFVPFFGSLIAASFSFGTTYYILKHILNKMEEVALIVVRTAGQGGSQYATNNEDNENPSYERTTTISEENLLTS